MASFKLWLTAAIGGTLLAGTALAANSTSVADSSNPVSDPTVICKKTLETGSLVRKNKQCFTKAQWDRIAEVQRRGNEKMVDGLSTRSGGN